MKILTKYTLKEFFPPFFLALICFTSILLFDEVFRLTKHFVKKGISPHYLIELLIYLLPVVIVLTIPMATLVGILLALGRLSTDNEVTAMKAHGVGFHQILLPLILTAAFLSIFDFVFMDYSLPRGNAAYSARKRDISMRNPAFVLEEGVVMRELEREQKLWMYESMDPLTKRLQNVRVWDSIWGGKPRFIHAKEATIGFEEDGQAWLALFDGTTYETASDDLQEFRVTAFDRQRVALDFTEALERNEYKAQRPKGMSIAGLKSYIERKQTEAVDAREKIFCNQAVTGRTGGVPQEILYSVRMFGIRSNWRSTRFDSQTERQDGRFWHRIGTDSCILSVASVWPELGETKQRHLAGARHVDPQHRDRCAGSRIQSTRDAGRKAAGEVLSPRDCNFRAAWCRR